jgi:hypothetical protein
MHYRIIYSESQEGSRKTTLEIEARMPRTELSKTS